MLARTYILTIILTLVFTVLYISLFAGILILIGLSTGLILGPRGFGFLITAIILGYYSARGILSASWTEIQSSREIAEHDKVKKEEKVITKESIEHENRLEALRNKYLISRKKNR